MKVTFLTAGTGSYHCGACMRDNTLVTALHRDGHEVALLPMYLPMELDEEVLPQVKAAPIFFGGINVYLQQKFSLFRHTPRWLDRLLNGGGLLRAAARRSHMTSAREQGEMTLAMLRVDESRLTKELDKLIEWLEHHEKPDLICLSNALLAGLTRELKRRLGLPVIACFQGEDSFLDGLPEPFRGQCWDEMKTRLEEADLLVAPTRFYADFMAERLGIDPGGIELLPNGILLEGYGPAQPVEPPAIGFLARMTEEKGLGIMIDAFLAMQEKGGKRRCQLKIGGACTAGDEKYVATLKEKIAKAGLSEMVSWHPNLTREEKAEFLRSLTLFSVPVIYPEAFGIYVVEAMASGVSVVMPDAASFPEIIAATEGGVLVPPGDPGELADAWGTWLGREGTLLSMGESGRRGVEEHYSVEAMKKRFVELAEGVLAARAGDRESEKRKLIS